MDDKIVDRLVRSALAAGVLDTSPHPDPDTLFHYHASELSATEADAVQGHLAVCPACARAVLDFEVFPGIDAPSEDDVPTAEEIEAGWADVRVRMKAADPMGVDPAPHASAAAERRERAEEDTPPAKVVPMTPRGGGAPRLVTPPASTSRRAPAWLQTAAAVLAVVALGLGAYALRLRGDVGELRSALDEATRPSGGVYDDDLTPTADVVRGVTDLGDVSVPDWAALVVLHLNPIPGAPRLYPGELYDVELVREGTPPEIVYRDPRVRPNDEGVVNWQFRRGRFAQGRYRLRLTPAIGKAPREYEFTLIYE